MALFIPIAIIVALTVAFWAHIQEFLQDHVIPFVGEHLGDKYADGLRKLVAALDSGVVSVRRGIKQAYHAFKDKVLGSTEKYTRTGADEVTRQRETYVANDEGKVIRRIETDEVSWDAVPKEIRAGMLAKNTKKGSLDAKEQAITTLEKKAEEQGLLELVD